MQASDEGIAFAADGEVSVGADFRTLKAASRSAGFTPKTPVIEITGVCAHCREK